MFSLAGFFVHQNWLPRDSHQPGSSTGQTDKPGGNKCSIKRGNSVFICFFKGMDKEMIYWNCKVKHSLLNLICLIIFLVYLTCSLRCFHVYVLCVLFHSEFWLYALRSTKRFPSFGVYPFHISWCCSHNTGSRYRLGFPLWNFYQFMKHLQILWTESSVCCCNWDTGLVRSFQAFLSFPYYRMGILCSWWLNELFWYRAVLNSF